LFKEHYFQDTPMTMFYWRNTTLKMYRCSR